MEDDEVPDPLQVDSMISELGEHLRHDMSHGSPDQCIGITLNQIRTKLEAPQKFNPVGDRARFLDPHTLLLYR
jgi:hypothetical protein